MGQRCIDNMPFAECKCDRQTQPARVWRTKEAQNLAYCSWWFFLLFFVFQQRECHREWNNTKAAPKKKSNNHNNSKTLTTDNTQTKCWHKNTVRPGEVCWKRYIGALLCLVERFENAFREKKLGLRAWHWPIRRIRRNKPIISSPGAPGGKRSQRTTNCLEMIAR